MLLQAILATHLIFAPGSSTVQIAPPDDLSALPTAMAPERAADFVSLLASSSISQSPTPPPPPNPSVNPPTTPPPAPNSLRSKLQKKFSGESRGNIVKVTLVSHRTVTGKLVSVDSESFTLRSSAHSTPIKIRYAEVVGQPKFRPSANEVIGRTFLAAACILAIPAFPFLFLAFASGAIAD
jgi:small nuclear ribonucleoprotein (snRNP)-like protein